MQSIETATGHLTSLEDLPEKEIEATSGHVEQSTWGQLKARTGE